MKNFDLKLQRAKKNSRILRRLPEDEILFYLLSLEKALVERSHELLEANKFDLENFKKSPHWGQTLEDRLRLTPQRIQAMAESLSQVRGQTSAFGAITQEKTLKNGLSLKKIRDSFGVVLFIFESRPNVILEAFSLALRSRNIILFRNGKESLKSSRWIYSLMSEVSKMHKIDFDLFEDFSDLNRSDLPWILTQKDFIDLVIPRGGDGLIQSIKEHSLIPWIINDRGLCHLYVDKAADCDMAYKILENAKLQRPSVCNSLETLLVHDSQSSSFLPSAFSELLRKCPQLEIRGCDKTFEILNKNNLANFKLATKEDFHCEHLDFIINVKVVKNLEEALEHIAIHGSKHSEAIVTTNKDHGERFLSEVDAACVYWNASTRFTDGFEFGLGGEFGISTQKLHVRGPLGLEALTSERWIIVGDGQIR